MIEIAVLMMNVMVSIIVDLFPAERISKDSRAWTMRCLGADFRVRRQSYCIIKGCECSIIIDQGSITQYGVSLVRTSQCCNFL
jgi:hypothetical protein